MTRLSYKNTPKISHMVFWTKFLYPDFSEEGKEEISVGHVGVFCQNLGISAYILENCSNSKNKF